MRWLHIYLSMFGLAAVLFFSVTGITLNHPDWAFGQVERHGEADGQLQPRWLSSEHAADRPKSDSASNSSFEVAKLDVVEHLRKTHTIRGALADFRIDDNECLVTFKGPGYSADAFIDRATGHYHLTEVDHGVVALINDLHKGRDTGPVWSVVIDLAACLMTVISLTGLVLLFYLKLRRVSGLLVALIGGVVIVAVTWFFVP
jgi:hypothetical protein